MGGKILEYEAKTILNQGREDGVQEGVFAKAVQVYFNMLERGYPPAEAQAVSGLTDEEIEKSCQGKEKYSGDYEKKSVNRILLRL